MKKRGFEHQGASTYLVYELEAEDTVDSMGLGMLMNNQIPGLAPAIFTQVDNIKQVKYNVTAQVPASQYLLGTVNKKMLLGVFRGIACAFLSTEEYMIAPETIQLDLGSVFVDVATGKTTMVCIPVVHEEKREGADLRSFLKGILFGAQYDERENRDYVAKIMSYLNGAPTFSVREFMELLNYVDITPTVQTPQQPLPQAPDTAQQPAVPSGSVKPASNPLLKPEGDAVPPGPQPVDSGEGQAQGDQKQISLFYLLQHYNKDNAATYKAQKEAKKAAKKGKSEQKKVEKQKGPPQGFAVPGQEAPSDETGGNCIPEPPKQSVQPVQPLTPQPVQQFSAQPIQPQPVQPAQFPVPPQPVQQYPVQPVQQPMQPAAQQSFQQAFPQQPVPGGAIGTPVVNVRVDTVYYSEDDDDKTIPLGQEAPARRLTPHLVRKRNQERIPINKPVFRLGRDRSYNDYPLVDNRYIGHSHCHIVCRDGEYFIVDDNSKNRTKVNGGVIAPGVEIKIAHGYTICLADEEFEFKLY